MKKNSKTDLKNMMMSYWTKNLMKLSHTFDHPSLLLRHEHNAKVHRRVRLTTNRYTRTQQLRCLLLHKRNYLKLVFF